MKLFMSKECVYIAIIIIIIIILSYNIIIILYYIIMRFIRNEKTLRIFI